MKKIVYVLVFLASVMSAFAGSAITSKPETDAEWNMFLTSLAMVESSGRDTIKHLDTNGRYSYGCLQIQTPYLQDSRLNYTLEDMYVRSKAFEVAKAYLTRYANSYAKRTGKPVTYEVLARIHNGGPRGAEHSATNGYWQKVRSELEK